MATIDDQSSALVRAKNRPEQVLIAAEFTVPVPGCISRVMGKNGHRLSFLVVEAEPAQGLSTRKLLLESAKHNVITAYSATEGIEMFKRFPKVDVVVIDGELKGNSRLAKEVKQQNPDIRIVCLNSRIGAKADWADETADPHDAAALLKLLQEMGGRTDI